MYRLKLPNIYKIYLVFYIYLFKPYYINIILNYITSSLIPINEITEDDINNREYFVEEILKSRRYYNRL